MLPPGWLVTPPRRRLGIAYSHVLEGSAIRGTVVGLSRARVFRRATAHAATLTRGIR